MHHKHLTHLYIIAHPLSRPPPKGVTATKHFTCFHCRAAFLIPVRQMCKYANVQMCASPAVLAPASNVY